MQERKLIQVSQVLATIFGACMGTEPATDQGNEFRPGEGCGVASQLRTNGVSIYCSFSEAPLGDLFDTGRKERGQIA